MSYQPVFDLGTIASIPARSDWDLDITLYIPTATSTAVANAAVLAAEDVVRFRMFSSDDATALISATDEAASANGTTVTISDRGTAGATPANVLVKISDTDLDLTNGSYHVIVDVQDASDSSRWHPACKGTIVVTPGPA